MPFEMDPPTARRRVGAPVFMSPEHVAALKEVDDAPFGRAHVKVALVAGVGFFTDAYDLFAISIVSVIIGMVYGTCDSSNCAGNAPGNHLSSTQDLGIKIAALVGTLVGQVVFGWLADKVGRKRMYGIELTVMIISTFGQAISGGARSVNAIGTLIAWRFVMGIGIGGDYPVSAVIASEFASSGARGRLMTAVFAAQAWGTFTGPLVALVVVSGFRQLTGDNLSLENLDAMWRLIIGMGCVPAAVALYFRLTISETPRFTIDIEHNIKQAQRDIHDTFHERNPSDHSEVDVQRVQAPLFTVKDFTAYFSRWKNLKVLFATAYSWFALDIAFYGLFLNNALVQTDLISSTSTTKSYLIKVCNASLLTSFPLIIGSYTCFLFIDSWGRKPIQLMGFTALAIVFLIMGAGHYFHLSNTAFIALYCVASFFQNFGPNTTTFIVPGEAFPTRYRSTAHGVSAACGKLGAIVAQIIFWQLDNDGNGLAILLLVYAFFMFTGVLSTLLLTETKQKSLELLSHDDGFTYDVPVSTEGFAYPYEDEVALSALRS